MKMSQNWAHREENSSPQDLAARSDPSNEANLILSSVKSSWFALTASCPISIETVCTEQNSSAFRGEKKTLADREKEIIQNEWPNWTSEAKEVKLKYQIQFKQNRDLGPRNKNKSSTNSNKLRLFNFTQFCFSIKQSTL